MPNISLQKISLRNSEKRWRLSIKETERYGHYWVNHSIQRYVFSSTWTISLPQYTKTLSLLYHHNRLISCTLYSSKNTYKLTGFYERISVVRERVLSITWDNWIDIWECLYPRKQCSVGYSAKEKSHRQCGSGPSSSSDQEDGKLESSSTLLRWWHRRWLGSGTQRIMSEDNSGLVIIIRSRR
jgi:hypothetical protein